MSANLIMALGASVAKLLIINGILGLLRTTCFGKVVRVGAYHASARPSGATELKVGGSQGRKLREQRRGLHRTTREQDGGEEAHGKGMVQGHPLYFRDGGRHVVSVRVWRWDAYPSPLSNTSFQCHTYLPILQGPHVLSEAEHNAPPRPPELARTDHFKHVAEEHAEKIDAYHRSVADVDGDGASSDPSSSTTSSSVTEAELGVGSPPSLEQADADEAEDAEDVVNPKP